MEENKDLNDIKDVDVNAIMDIIENIENLDEDEENKINEEYKIWKKNSPFLYDIALEWPSLTIQWMPDKISVPDKEYCVQHDEQNYLLLAEVRLPKEDTELDARAYADEKVEMGGFGGAWGKVETVQKICIDKELNRARFMPQNPNIIACRTGSPELLVFDKSKHPNNPDKEGLFPDVLLEGHEKEGFGISWNNIIQGHLLSSGDDGLICLWDIQKATKENHTLSPLRIFMGHHEQVVEDVDWHAKNEYLFGSVGDDKTLCLWDIRETNSKPINQVMFGEKEVNCLNFNPFSEYLLVTGSADHTLALWDIRKLQEPFHILANHTDQIFRVQWSPFNDGVLASAGADRRINIWDISHIGEPQTPEDAMDGPPELLFIHGGHSDKVSDFSWNHHEDWMIASVADNNILQIWQMADNIYADEDEPFTNPS